MLDVAALTWSTLLRGRLRAEAAETPASPFMSNAYGTRGPPTARWTRTTRSTKERKMRHPWQSAGLMAAVALTAVVALGATALPSVARISIDIHLVGGNRGAYLIPGSPVYYVDGY